MIAKSHIVVRYAETDQMGIVHQKQKSGRHQIRQQ
mgnify:CR=1 FL=1